MKKEKNERNKNLSSIKVDLSFEKKGNYENLYIVTPQGVKFQVKLAFYNRKLLYKILCEIEGK